jgi:glycosyltransferase involved in cell wall biosynthesis
MGKKVILFLSALDFKQKTIQVIRKTPEAYLSAGWEVYYLVARDNSKYGNYFYEEEIIINGVNIKRIYWPLKEVHDKVKNAGIRTVISKIRSCIIVIMLAYHALSFLKQHKVDVIYGYEVQGVLAVNLLRILGLTRHKKIVSRFQGTYLYNSFEKKNYKKIIFNLDHLLALYLPSDLCIMTNDGTQGDKLLKRIRSKNVSNLKFWANGVDCIAISKDEQDKFKLNINPDKKFTFLTVCRLERWKRVDRVIEIIKLLVNKYGLHDFRLLIVGDGVERNNLENMSHRYNLENYISFEGAKPHSEVQYYLSIADILFSTYDLSNVGNPLLEAIRAHKIIFTINNGDTGKWIEHKKNGFIYSLDDKHLIDNMVKDVVNVLTNLELRKSIINKIIFTEKKLLWTWENRFNAEIENVERLFQ